MLQKINTSGAQGGAEHIPPKFEVFNQIVCRPSHMGCPLLIRESCPLQKHVVSPDAYFHTTDNS